MDFRKLITALLGGILYQVKTGITYIGAAIGTLGFIYRTAIISPFLMAYQSYKSDAHRADHTPLTSLIKSFFVGLGTLVIAPFIAVYATIYTACGFLGFCVDDLTFRAKN